MRKCTSVNLIALFKVNRIPDKEYHICVIFMIMNNWYKATLLETVSLSPRVKLLTVQGKGVDAIPGQYVSVKVRENGILSPEREYSFIETQKKDIFQLAVNLLDTGELSPKLHALNVGDDIYISGPKGNHFLLNGSEKHFVCIAGGTGVAPFVGLLRNNNKSLIPKKITLIVSFKSQEEYLFQEELQTAIPHTKVVVTLTQSAPDSWAQLQGRINAAMITSAIDGERKDDIRFYICGGSLFVENMREVLATMNIPVERVNYERFG